VGAAFGGPIGAGGAVVAMAAADMTSAGIDWYYAKRLGDSLEERRQLLIIHRNFAAIQNRNLANDPISETTLAFYRRMVARRGGDADMRRLLSQSGPATDVIDRIYRTHLGRPATPQEMLAGQDMLGRGGWLADLEEGVIAMRRAPGR
jgi:hypothetical protein